MNRKQRRKLKVDNSLRANIELERIKGQMKIEATEVATLLMFYISTLVLRDKFGFGKVRLEKFMKHATEMMLDISDNRLDFLDIQKVIKEETGYEIPLPPKRLI